MPVSTGFSRGHDGGEHDRSCRYAAFRAGLLTHISWEEKILLPAAQRARGGRPHHGGEAAARSRRARGIAGADPDASNHRGAARLLVTHNVVEEGPGGVRVL